MKEFDEYFAVCYEICLNHVSFSFCLQNFGYKVKKMNIY